MTLRVRDGWSPRGDLAAPTCITVSQTRAGAHKGFIPQTVRPVRSQGGLEATSHLLSTTRSGWQPWYTQAVREGGGNLGTHRQYGRRGVAPTLSTFTTGSGWLPHTKDIPLSLCADRVCAAASPLPVC